MTAIFKTLIMWAMGVGIILLIVVAIIALVEWIWPTKEDDNELY